MGPDLTMPVFYAAEPWHSERIGALALYCSDGRWGEAFDEFCHRHLLIPRYDRLALPGGPAWLVDEIMRQTSRLLLDFLVTSHELERLVLIAHYGCAWYTQLLQQDAGECLPAQTADVRRAATTLRAWYPHVQVEGYLAMRSHHLLSFHQLDI